MEQKKLMPGIIVIAVIALVLALLTVLVSAKVQPGTDSGNTLNEEKAIVGTWQETTTQLQMTFTKDDAFQMAGSTVATYTIDPETKNIHLVYGEAYGGQQADMSYLFLDENTLQLTDASGVHTYQRLDN